MLIEVLSQCPSGGTEKGRRGKSGNTRWPGGYSIRVPPGYDSKSVALYAMNGGHI
jgi:hypothetical protein